MASWHERAIALIRLSLEADGGLVKVYYGHNQQAIVGASYGDRYAALDEGDVYDRVNIYRYEDSAGLGTGDLSWVIQLDDAGFALGNQLKDIVTARRLDISATGFLSMYYTDVAPTIGLTELDTWTDTSTNVIYIRKDALWVEIENNWNYWTRLNAGTVIVDSGEVSVKYNGLVLAPSVSIYPHQDNNPVHTTRITDNVPTKLGDKYLLQLIHDMYIVFIGRLPEVEGFAYWIQYALDYSPTEDELAEIIYNTAKLNLEKRALAASTLNKTESVVAIVDYSDSVDVPSAVTYLAGTYQPPSNIQSGSLVESSAKYNEHPVSNLEVVPIFNELMQAAVGKDSIYIRAKDTLNDFLKKPLEDEVPMTQNERATILANALVSMTSSITSNAMSSAVGIAKDNRDSNMNATKLVEEVKSLAEQRKAIANKTIIDRALADVQIATAKTALSSAQRKYVEDAEKWAINRDMITTQKLTSDIDYGFKTAMSQADLDTKESTLTGMAIDQAFNTSKKTLMEDTRKDNIRMKAAEQYAEFLKYISAANVVPGDHHFTNLVGLISSVIAGQNLPDSAYTMLNAPGADTNVVSAPAVKNPV